MIGIALALVGVGAILSMLAVPVPS
jgi:hypothetical protein